MATKLAIAALVVIRVVINSYLITSILGPGHQVFGSQSHQRWSSDSWFTES